MEPILVLLGLGRFAIPVIVIYLFVAHFGLRARITALERDLARMMADGAPKPGAARIADVAPRVKPRAPDAVSEAPKDGAPEAEKTPEKPAQPAAARVVAARKAASAPPSAPPPAPQGPNRIERALRWLAGNWFYAISALSLALAGLFLVQYGVENGLLPPAARVLAALAFGAALIAGGEVIRRRFGDGPDSATAYLPSVFSGAGLVTLFGGVVAARLLYDLVGVEVAFVGLAAVGLLGVGLGWLHGPLLTTVGVVGAFGAPMLVGSTEPAGNALFVYFAVVTAVGLGVDTLRRWAWVSVLSVMLGFVMGWLTVLGGGADLTIGFQAHMIVLAVLATLIPARSFWPDHGGAMVFASVIRPSSPRPDFPTALAAAGVIAASVGIVWSSTTGPEAFWMAVASLVILMLALTLWSTTAQALEDIALMPAIGVVAAVLIEGSERGEVLRAFQAAYEASPEADFPLAVSVLWAIGLGLSVVAALRALRPGLGVFWALAAALIAPVMAIALEVMWAPAAVIGAYPWALHAMVMAIVMVSLALRFAQADGQDRTRASLFVLSALASISFALVLILSLAALTVALAVTVLVAGLLDRQFKLPLMQIVITVGVPAVGVRLIADPGLDWAMDAPIWELVLAYGGALVAFVAALRALRGLSRITAQVMLETGAWSTGGTLLSLLLFRALEGWTGTDNNGTHWAMGLYATIWFGLMIAQLLRFEALRGWLNALRAVLAAVFGLLGLLALLLGLTMLSPLFTSWGGDVAGLPVLNTLLVAYLLPAAVLALGAWRMRMRWVRLGLFGLATALTAFWAFAALRHVWQGADGIELRFGYLQGELYSYTVALLVLGAALFYQSLARASTPLRRAGLVVIGLAVAKVFLIDISGLDGLTRVLSLVVLGLSLAALAWLNRWAQERVSPD